MQAKNDKLGKKFSQDNELRDLLAKRNSSILAHGLDSAKEEAYQRLSEKTVEYASLIIEKLDTMLQDSVFAKWN